MERSGVLMVLSFFLIQNGFSAPTVSIIGGGIGAGACSYYLQKFGYTERVHAFEKNNYIGGRINEIQFGGQVRTNEQKTPCIYPPKLEEIGADAWSPVNYYIQEIQEELNIAIGTSTYDGNGEVGIWSADEFTAYKKIILQNPVTDTCVATQIRQFIASLDSNYEERNSSSTFTTVNEFLSYGNMTGYSLQTFEAFLMSECNATQEYMDTLVAPIVRAIYDQPMNLTSFAGEVSLLAIFTPALWAAKGNSQLPKSLFIAAEAIVHMNTEVHTISWNGDHFELLFNETESFNSDYVVIAAPIEKTGIEFQNINFTQPIIDREFVHCYVTHVQATGLNPEYFDLPEGEEVPDSVLTTPSSTKPFTIIGIRDPSLTVPGAKIYKIFSNTDISGILSNIFLEVSDSHVHLWEYTFPNLQPTSSYQPIQLAPNLYYLNTMESIVTAMEGSVIAGRNVAQLLLQEFSNQ